MGVIQDGASNKKTNNTKRERRKRTTTATIGGRFLWACVINVVRRDSIWYDFILGKFLILLSKDWTQKCWANMFSLLNERCILTATLEQPRQATTNLLLSLPIKTSVYLLGAALRFLPLPSSLFPGENVTCRLILTLLLTTTSTISFLMNSSIHLGHVYILIKMCKINKYSLFSDGFLSSWPYSILISWSHWKLSFLPQGKPCKDSRFWVSQDQCILLM